MTTNFDTVMQAVANLHFVNEHGIKHGEGADMKHTALTKYHKILCTGPTDSNMSRAGGGVGIVYDAHYTVILLDPLTPEFKKVTQQGRALAFSIDYGDGNATYAYILYGKSGGHECKHKATVTNRIIKAIRCEQSAQPSGPTVILGDTNADPEDLPVLQKLLSAHLWIDVGAHASWWGGFDAQPTCITANSGQATRRDYIFCDNSFFPLYHPVSSGIAQWTPHPLLPLCVPSDPSI